MRKELLNSTKMLVGIRDNYDIMSARAEDHFYNINCDLVLSVNELEDGQYIHFFISMCFIPPLD